MICYIFIELEVANQIRLDNAGDGIKTYMDLYPEVNFFKL
jgi:hypothetical protein